VLNVTVSSKVKTRKCSLRWTDASKIGVELGAHAKFSRCVAWRKNTYERQLNIAVETVSVNIRGYHWITKLKAARHCSNETV